MNQEKYKKIFESEEARKYSQSICELAKEEIYKILKDYPDQRALDNSGFGDVEIIAG